MFLDPTPRSAAPRARKQWLLVLGCLPSICGDSKPVGSLSKISASNRLKPDEKPDYFSTVSHGLLHQSPQRFCRGALIP